MDNNLWLVKRNALEYRKERLKRGPCSFDVRAFNRWAASKPPDYIEMLATVPADELNTFWQNDVAWAARGMEDPCVARHLAKV